MKREDTYDIELVSMKEGVHEFDWHIGPEFFEQREGSGILGADIDVALDVTRRRDSYELLFSFEGTLQVACDRCLEAVPVPVDDEYRVVVRYGEEYDDSQEDLLVIPDSWTRLDVAPMIYDSLMLAVPLRCVHPEGECDRSMAEVLRRHSDSEDEQDATEQD